jgi:hypothetical protein
LNPMRSTLLIGSASRVANDASPLDIVASLSPDV